MSDGRGIDLVDVGRGVRVRPGGRGTAGSEGHRSARRVGGGPRRGVSPSSGILPSQRVSSDRPDPRWVDQLVETPEVHRVLGQTTRAEHAHRDRERRLGRHACSRPSPRCTSGNSAPAIIWWTATTRAASWRSRPAVSPPTRYSASTARPSWVSSWPASPLASVRRGWCEPLTKVTTCVPISCWRSAVGPCRGDAGSGRDEQVPVGHHHPGASLTQLDVRLDVGRERAVPVELGLRELHERVGVEPGARIRRVGVGTVARIALRLLQQRGLTAPNCSMLSARNSRSRGTPASAPAGAARGASPAAGAPPSGPRRR